MINPKFSIITPSFNQGQYIEETILSIINQSYKNYELIIIDGGSTDNTVEILKKYNTEIEYWVCEPDKGTYDADNKGLAKATGDYWMVVNSDDTLTPDALEILANKIESYPDTKWFCGGINYINKKSTITGTYQPTSPKPVLGYTFLAECWISHPTVCLSIDLYYKFGGFDKYHMMDLAYWLKLEDNKIKPFVIDKTIANLRLHQNCKSNDRIKLTEEHLRIIQDFTNKKGIQSKKEVKSIICFIKQLIIQRKIHQSISGSDRLNSIKLILLHVLKHPLLMRKRWFLGAIKRAFFSINSSDPLKTVGISNPSNANWNEN
ncbi:glycosyltransferase family 2 protein [Labilibacter marinus]|uniref:glycosyltransferase family 2 protein n=1 Tax=Labilibacter marinus TaxID=1477105 RepID=UPI00094F9078|nr:glycosyltransferase family 2 protein [Labilibacter marinus]